MGSIEGAFIGIARYAMHHWRDLTWFPLWYGGVPYQNTYPPLLHLCVAAFATIFRTSPAHAYHFLTALAYCLGPVALYALALRWTASRWTAFVAGLLYSALSFSPWILPAVRHDLGGIFYPRRLQALVYYGEGPHVAALTLLPLVLLAIDLAATRRRPQYIFLAAISVAALVLTNWFAAVSLAVAIGCLLLAKSFSKEPAAPAIAAVALIGVCAYLLAMPLLPPSTILTTFSSNSTVEGDFVHTYGAFPLRAAALIAVFALMKFAVRRLSLPLQFAIFFTFTVAVFAIASFFWNINIVPQAHRYELEMEMGLSLLLALAAASFLKNRAAAIALAVLIVLLIQPVRRDRNYARNFLLRSVDITTTIEWRTADWLNRHWSGERVMAAGSEQFWLTAFSDTPELAGGYDPGILERIEGAAIYLLYSDESTKGREAEYSILWLKALGVQAAGVSGPASTEFFKPYRHPHKYDGVLPVLWRDGDDALYRVEPRASLARIVPRSSLVTRVPVNGLDVEPLRPYVAALDDPALPRADFVWTSAHSAKIHGALAAGQVISVQEAWHRGWHANASITHDALGQMVLDPGHPGPFDIDLIYDGGAEMKIAKILSACTALALVFFSLRGILKKSW